MRFAARQAQQRLSSGRNMPTENRWASRTLDASRASASGRCGQEAFRGSAGASLCCSALLPSRHRTTAAAASGFLAWCGGLSSRQPWRMEGSPTTRACADRRRARPQPRQESTPGRKVASRAVARSSAPLAGGATQADALADVGRERREARVVLWDDGELTVQTLP